MLLTKKIDQVIGKILFEEFKITQPYNSISVE